MKCSLCGYEFDEKEAERTCKGCPVMAGCKLIKCPRCNFEMPPEPDRLKIFKKRRKSDEDK